MADITVTAANVTPGSGAGLRYGTAGATITAGQTVYLDTTDNKYKLARANAASTAQVAGIALHGASNNQPLTIHTGGAINIGGTVAVGAIYVLSAAAAGGIAPAADLTTTNRVSVIGVGTTTGIIAVDLQNSGVAVA